MHNASHVFSFKSKVELLEALEVDKVILTLEAQVKQINYTQRSIRHWQIFL